MENVIVSGLDKISKEIKTHKFKDEETSIHRIARQKQEAFQLLIAQLKNQDPTNPMDTAQMTQQIFAINNVEQQVETNKHLTDIKDFLSLNKHSNYINYIGKNAVVEGDSLSIENGRAVLQYELSQIPLQSNIEIYNSFGSLVYSRALNPNLGRNSFQIDDSFELPDGKYSYKINAIDSNQQQMHVKQFSTEKIIGIVEENGMHFIEINGKLVPADQIKKLIGDTV